jgi:toprim domain protein
MITAEPDRVIIVEGLTDKRRIEKVIDDEVTILCTNGTLGLKRFDEMLETYDLDMKDVFIFVDEDRSGWQLRKLLSQELPHAEHMYVSRDYREVAATPERMIAAELAHKQFTVNPFFLKRN